MIHFNPDGALFVHKEIASHEVFFQPLDDVVSHAGRLSLHEESYGDW